MPEIGGGQSQRDSSSTIDREDTHSVARRADRHALRAVPEYKRQASDTDEQDGDSDKRHWIGRRHAEKKPCHQVLDNQRAYESQR